MPNRRTHKLVGAASGAAYAGYRAKEQSGLNWWAEVAGGGLGGFFGGPLPDAIEPAISPWHRDLAHSWAAGTGILATKNLLAAWETACRENADKCRAIPMTLVENFYVPVPVDPLSHLLSRSVELFWRFLAGFLNGIAAGYVSHLALDAVTPRSIPLLAAGF